jgi:argininosuccinate lyase
MAYVKATHKAGLVSETERNQILQGLDQVCLVHRNLSSFVPSAIKVVKSQDVGIAFF